MNKTYLNTDLTDKRIAVLLSGGVDSSVVVYELAQGYLDGAIKSRIEPMIEKKNRGGHDYYANIHQFYNWMEKAQKEKERKGK